MKLYLIAVGMGNSATLTREAVKAIETCSVLIGGKRLLTPYENTEKTCVPLVYAQEIADYLKENTTTTKSAPVGILLSGDIGFYSGAKSLRPFLEDLPYEVEGISGISSLSYFCCKIGISWEDVRICSAHGRSHNLVGEVQCHPKVFALTGGENKVNVLCQQLKTRGLAHVLVTVGENLSYPEEMIYRGTAEAFAEKEFADLSVMLIENPTPIPTTYQGKSIADEAFLRDKTPMTKEEVRHLAVGKLQLSPDHTVWDIGAGTGSVSVACALAVPKGVVYAIEQKDSALDLILQNKEKFGTSNLISVCGVAPQCLTDLPTPHRVFLGGTSGHLKEILEIIFTKNKNCRIVLTAVTLETLAVATQCFSEFNLTEVDMSQIAITKTRTVGQYHLFDANNPVWMLSGVGS